MTFNNKLDEILLGLSYAFLKHSQPGGSDTGFLIEKLCEAFKMDVSAVELVLFKEKLLADGFIEHVKKDRGFPLFKLTAMGLDFITGGGYTGLMQTDKSTSGQIPDHVGKDDPGDLAVSSMDNEPSTKLKPDPKGYLTLPQAADYLGLSVSSMYRLTGQSKIRCYKPGKQKMFLKKDLDEYVNAGVRQTEQEIKAGAQKSLSVKKSKN